jgi:hypothetical protein
MPPNIHREHYSYSLESHQDSFQFLSSPASFFLFFRFIISLLSYLTYIYIFSPSGIFGCHADSLQHGRFVIQRNFIPPPYAEESQQLPREEENLFYSFESCDPRLLFRLGTFSPSHSTRWFFPVCVSVVSCVCVGVKLEYQGGRKPASCAFIGPFLVAPEWKGQQPPQQWDYARQKGERFTLSLFVFVCGGDL